MLISRNKKMGRGLGEVGGLESPSHGQVRTIQDLAERAKSEVPEGEEVMYTWAFVFDMPTESLPEVDEDELGQTDGKY